MPLSNYYKIQTSVVTAGELHMFSCLKILYVHVTKVFKGVERPVIVINLPYQQYLQTLLINSLTPQPPHYPK